MQNEQQQATLQPEDLAAVQRIFKQISSEDWFSRDPERTQKFGAFLIRAYQSGIVDFVHLHDLALRTARESFARTDTMH